MGIFGLKRDEVTGEWRKLHNEELRNLYCSPSVIRIIKSRRMRWAGQVTRLEEDCMQDIDETTRVVETTRNTKTLVEE
jgi:hypothetical protein